METYINKIFPLPYIRQDGTQKYPVPMIKLINYVQISAHTNLRDLVEALMSSDKALKEVDPGSYAPQRLEAQIIQNSNFYLDNAVLNWMSNEKRKGIKLFLSRYF